MPCIMGRDHVVRGLMRAASWQSRLTSRTGAAAWLRDMLLRAVPSKLATRHEHDGDRHSPPAEPSRGGGLLLRMFQPQSRS